MFVSVVNCRTGGSRNNLEIRLFFMYRVLRTGLRTLSLAIVCFAACTHSYWRILSMGSDPRIVPISAIAFTDREHGWAVTAANILETDNGGRNWREKIAPDEHAFHSLTFVNSTTGWIVGSEFRDGNYVGLVFHTTDGGKSWHDKLIDSIPGLEAVSFCDASFGYAIGSEVIASTSDGGDNWKVLYRGETNRKPLAIECVTRERAWAVGDDGMILRTEDAGRSWVRQDAGVSSTLVRVRFFGNDGWILGTQGTILRTRDGGATWEREKLDLTNVLCDIHIAGLQGWIVGTEGTILYSSDGGNVWNRKKSPTDKDLFCLSFLDSGRGWAAGESQIVLGIRETQR